MKKRLSEKFDAGVILLGCLIISAFLFGVSYQGIISKSTGMQEVLVCNKWLVPFGNRTVTITRSQSEVMDMYYNRMNTTPVWHYDENKTCLQYVKVYYPKSKIVSNETI